MDGSMVFGRWRQCAPHPNTCFLGPTQVLNPNSISIGSAVSAQLTAERRYILQWAAHSPQNCPFSWHIRTPKLHIGISIDSAVFVGLTAVADRPTDHATRSVTIGRIVARSTAMRPKNSHVSLPSTHGYLPFACRDFIDRLLLHWRQTVADEKRAN